MVLTSLENEKVKNLIKLQRKKYRDLTHTFIVEGEHLVEEVLRKGTVIEIFCVEGEEFDFPCTFVSFEVMKKISTMDTPSKVIALCEKDSSSEIIGNKILILDEIQDPGNLGTIIRSAVAFHVDMIVLSEKCVDLYNPKVLRATQGMFCHIPIVSQNIKEILSFMRENGYKIYGTAVTNGYDVRTLSASEKEKYGLVMGNEGNGVSSEILSLCDKNLYISMNPEVESLNVAIASSILLYELER